MSEYYKFFQNKKCEYFPCHKGIPEADFNCLFCYCPLYTLGKSCGGNCEYLKNGIKSCINCGFPHHRKNYLVVFAPASSAPSKSSPAPLRFTARRSTFAMRLSTTAPLSKNSRPRAPSSLTTSRRFPTVRRLFFQPTAFPAASRTKRMPALCAFSTPRVPWSPKCTVRSSSFTTTARKSS